MVFHLTRKKPRTRETASASCGITSKRDKHLSKWGSDTLDKKAFEAIETRLLEVNKVIEKLDASIRVAAFEFLKPYIAGGIITAPKGGDGKT